MVLVKGLRAIVRGMRSKSWPTANGTIRTARIVKKHNSKGKEVWRHEIEVRVLGRGRELYRHAHSLRGTRVALVARAL